MAHPVLPLGSSGLPFRLTQSPSRLTRPSPAQPVHSAPFRFIRLSCQAHPALPPGSSGSASRFIRLCSGSPDSHFRLAWFSLLVQLAVRPSLICPSIWFTCSLLHGSPAHLNIPVGSFCPSLTAHLHPHTSLLVHSAPTSRLNCALTTPGSLGPSLTAHLCPHTSLLVHSLPTPSWLTEPASYPPSAPPDPPGPPSLLPHPT